MTSSVREGRPVFLPQPAAEARRHGRPVIIWAAIGAALLVVIVQGWTRWLLSGDLTATPSGSDPMPGWKLGILRGFEIGGVALALGVVAAVLIRPLIRDRRLTFDGMLILGIYSVVFWDPVVNYYNYSFAYNTHFFNVGSWVNFIPGWSSPNQALLPEPVLAVGFGCYIYSWFGGAVIGCRVMRAVQRRSPQASILRLVVVTGAVVAVLDLLVEGLFIFLEIWAYPGAGDEQLVIFGGHWYQFPLLEPILIAVTLTAVVSLRYFRDDHGRSFAERGIDQLRVKPGTKAALSTLAIVGFLNTWLLLMYFVPYNFIVAMRTDQFPALPSYMRAQVCGDGTAYACPHRGAVPVPGRSTLRIAPDDPRLPAQVRRQQGVAGR